MIRLPVPNPSLLQLVQAIERGRRSIPEGVIFETLPGSFANDTAAAAGGVALNQVYRNGSVLMVRTN